MAVTAKRGRPPAETARERVERLEREIAEAKAAVREEELRRFTVLGEAIAAEIEANPGFKTTVAKILRERVTSTQGKAAISAFLT